eukprot:TRINITY_DN111_c0_g1_i1.p1 TRINITY_DN111_c0_g1~~TRINITY_DN111_c0_g1_i1.p1  ORF type:complete len:913 (-),score=245.43 TRINITY_DN111_c0_g1_i1:52-2769(-)
MPLLETKTVLTARSERVKCVDVHPSEPWVLCALFSGVVNVWNYETKTLVKTFEVSDQLPVRTAKFIARKQWVVTGSDDCLLRVFNYNNMSKVKTVEAHNDFVRCIAVHPSQSLVLTSSDDMSIKLWDWDKNWTNLMLFDGHTHYVMQIAFNPKDPNTFATASLDRTVKVWGLNSPNAYFTLEGHEKGVNCVDYLADGDKPYLISGSDDRTAKVWDYQNKTCVATLTGHEHNVSSVSFHPELPLIMTGSEDGSIRLFNSNTYRNEKVTNFGLERAWTIGTAKGSNIVAMGFDSGAVIIKFGSDKPVTSMDSAGKIILARHSEILAANIKNAVDSENPDGERLPISTKDLGNSEVYPKKLQHSPNGRFVALSGGDGEYVIYTALAWRNKSFGKAEDFVWGDGSIQGCYAIRESSGRVKIFKDFSEVGEVKIPSQPDHIFGGTLLGIRSKGSVSLYTWDGRLVRQINATSPKKVFWSALPNGNGGDHCILSTDSSFYVIKYDSAATDRAYQAGRVAPDGVADSIDVIAEVNDKVRCGVWVGECFVYIDGNKKLKYCVGGQTVTVSHLPRPMYLLGYLPRDGRAFLMDKALNIVSYKLNMSVINFQIAMERGNAELAATLLPSIPVEEKEKVCVFLEGKGLFREALDISTDPDHKFELAIRLNDLEVANKLATESGQQHKWKQIGDLALGMGKFEMAQNCLTNAGDLSSLLVLFTALGDADGVAKLETLAKEKEAHNIEFICALLQSSVTRCIDLLVRTNRVAEAAFMARTYAPSQVSKMVLKWRSALSETNKRAAEALADPDSFPNLFEGLKEALPAERYLELISSNRPSGAAYAEQGATHFDRDPSAEAAEYFATHQDKQGEDVEKEKENNETKEVNEEVKAEEEIVKEEKEEQKEEEKEVEEEKTD